MPSILEADARGGSALVAAEPLRPVPFRVAQLLRETADTFTLALEPLDGRRFAFLPGQFDMLYVFGIGEVPISISGDPARPELLTHTIRAVGSVTRALQKLRPGEIVGVRGPFGTPWPLEAARGQDVVLVAGGIGLAPLRPVIYHALLQRGLYGRVQLLYGARTPHDLLFTRELKAWRSRFDMEVQVTVDRASGSWRGSVGVVTKLIDRAPIDAGSALAFVCGPEVMIRFSVMALEKRGLPHTSTFVSMERNMKCAVGLCGHCQFGPYFVCRDGPVFRYDRTLPWSLVREA
jgi:NAD(P)H-flavin reductase